MKGNFVYVTKEKIAAGLTELVHAIEPSDLPQIEEAARHADRATRGLYGLHAVLSQLLAPPPGPDRAPTGAAELNELEAVVMRLEGAVAKHGEMLEAMAEEVIAIAARLGPPAADPDRPTEFEAAPPAQTAALAVELPAPIAERLVDLANGHAEPTCGSCAAFLTDAESVAAGTCSGCRSPGPAQRVEVPPAIPQPSADGAHAAEVRPPETSKKAPFTARLRILALLAAGPHGSAAICDRLAMPQGTLAPTLRELRLASPPQCERDAEARYRITGAGRRALERAGYVLVPPETEPAETNPPEPATSAPKLETISPVSETLAPKRETPPTPTRPALLPKDERSLEQCRLVAAAIHAAEGKAMLLDEIAREAGLPIEVVQKRLNRQGPQAVGTSAKRYFAKSAKRGGYWVLTNSGESLATEAAV